MQQIKFAITTDGSGNYTSSVASAPQADISNNATGPMLLYAVEWVDGDLTDGVDAVLSMTNTLSGVDKTLLTLTNADNDAWYYPWALVVKNDGSTVATDFFAPQVVEGTLKLVVTNGGSTHTGMCIVYLKECE